MEQRGRLQLQQLKDEVRARTDIVELVSNYTRLKRSGKNWTGLCPFHDDTRPSFSVNPAGFYRCFACNEKGDVFTFVQKKEGLDFLEALQWLCRRAGIPFQPVPGDVQKSSEREEALELNRLAVAFFQDRLGKSSDARDYLAHRGILKPTQEQWQIGFAPPDWDGLTRYLERHRANLALAARIGLIRERKPAGSGYYDVFRNRLILPIQDMVGQVIAFGGRAMSPEEAAKYINSEQSFLFDKSRTLYGLYFARRVLSNDTPPVFVEGYLDVITAHQAGFPQCVATLGTAMTEAHARILSRFNPKVIICYDADTAGIRATLRGATVWESIGVEGAQVLVARLPAGEDPDSLLRQGDTAAFQAALDSAVPRAEFEIALALERHDLQTPEGRVRALEEIIPILASVPSLSDRSNYVSRILPLHPLATRSDPRRVVDQILADVERYAQQSRQAQAPRDRGYPLTQEINGQPLQETPPPVFQPPDRNSWGQSQWPFTENYIGRRENAQGSGVAKQGFRSRRKQESNTPRLHDPRPPEVTPPVLTREEKAERQLLRALFTADWRTYLLTHHSPDSFVTEHGRRLFERVARTPAQEDGSVDPVRLLRQVEHEEDLLAPPADDPFADEPLPSGTGAEGTPSGSTPSFSPRNEPISPGHAKFSAFVRELLEESVYLASNEQLNLHVVNSCMSILRRHRIEQALRELNAVLEAGTLPPEQRRTLLEEYRRKSQELRGVSS